MIIYIKKKRFKKYPIYKYLNKYINHQLDNLASSSNFTDMISNLPNCKPPGF